MDMDLNKIWIIKDEHSHIVCVQCIWYWCMMNAWCMRYEWGMLDIWNMLDIYIYDDNINEVCWMLYKMNVICWMHEWGMMNVDA